LEKFILFYPYSALS